MGLAQECGSLTATPFPKCSYPIQDASPQDSLSEHIVEVHHIRCFLQSTLRAISSVARINGHSEENGADYDLRKINEISSLEIPAAPRRDS
jgi:hypothetical protein